MDFSLPFRLKRHEKIPLGAGELPNTSYNDIIVGRYTVMETRGEECLRCLASHHLQEMRSVEFVTILQSLMENVSVS
jgi:hypothetical protein